MSYDPNISNIQVIFDGGGAAISASAQVDVEIPFNCTITGIDLLADVSGSIAIGIWSDSYANFPATDADSITGASIPTISGTTKYTDSTLTGWTTSITAGNILRFQVNTISTITRCTVVLKVRRT